MHGVLRVHASVREHSYEDPWLATPATRVGTAVMVSADRLVTTADVVADATFIQLERANEATKATARVRAFHHDCALAVLEVIGGHAVVSDLDPVELASDDVPEAYAELAIRYVTKGGGDAVLAAKLSHTAVVRCAHSQRHIPMLRVGAMLDDCGGAVFHDGKLAGLAIQTVNDETTFEAVPAAVIRAFLARAATKSRLELPSLGIATQRLDNPQLRAHLGLGDADEGVVITRVDHGGSGDGLLHRGDVLAAVDGRPVDDAGRLDAFGALGLAYDAPLAVRHVGDRMPVEILRAGQRLEIVLVLQPWRPLVPRARHDVAPRYLLFAGLLFQPLTRNYLCTWDEWWKNGPKEFLHAYFLGVTTPQQRELVVLTKVLGHALVDGYESLHNESVIAVDGHCPRDFDDFIARLTGPVTGTALVETSSGGMIALDRARARAATRELLEVHGISSEVR